MKKAVNIIPFEQLSGIFNKIDYEYTWEFTNGVGYNVKGHMKFRDYLLKLIFSNSVIKRYYDESFLKSTGKNRFYNDKKPIKNFFN